MKERIYLGGFEIYREYDGTAATVTLERETLHLMDGQQRIALVETRTQGDDGSPAQLIRYQFGNHLGSASLELDEAGKIISYEEYYPYGSTSYQAVDASIKAAAKRYRYTGKERDEETGLAYHGARYYAPWLGRWDRPDIFGLGDGVNRYAFVKCNPIRMSDRRGTSTLDEVESPPTPASPDSKRNLRGNHRQPKGTVRRDPEGNLTFKPAIPSATASGGMTGGQSPDALELDFAKVVSGRASQATAPAQIGLPFEVQESLMTDSGISLFQSPQGNVVEQEHGSYLMRRRGGAFELRYGGSGGSGGWNPVRPRGVEPFLSNLIPGGRRWLGTAHTHPYASGTKSSFSAGDLSTFALPRWLAGDRTQLIRSQDTVYLASRTAEFNRAVRAMGIFERIALAREITSMYENRYRIESSSGQPAPGQTLFQHATEAAAIEVAEALGLALYKGTGHVLQRMDDPNVAGNPRAIVQSRLAAARIQMPDNLGF